MASALKWLGQAATYILIAVILGSFADWPSYTYFPPDKALIKMGFAHGAERVGECRELTSEELQEKAANMRKARVCPRERIPIYVELRLDGELLYSASRPPTGLSGDGPSRVYEKFAVEPGRHHLMIGMRDTDRTDGFDYRRETEVELKVGESLAIGFRGETEGFTLL